MLLSYVCNYVSLNPLFRREKVLQTIRNVNNIACTIPCDDTQLLRIVNSIFKQKEEGKLTPKYWSKTRKIVFRANSALSYDEKMSIVRKEVAKKWKDISEQKIYRILENWDFSTYGKISQRKIYHSFNISSKTVEKYWPVFKEYVAELNNANK